MKISLIGGGAWGATLAQVLADNQHEVLIYEYNQNYVDVINHDHVHPVFNEPLDHQIRATSHLKEAVEFSHIFVLAVPIKAMRSVLNALSSMLREKSVFINVSKGLEIETQSFTSDIVKQTINPAYLEGFVCLSGPSHAEEVILRKVTLLVSASENEALSIFVQNLFHHSKYLRLYSSKDVKGVEVSGAVKNAIAVISGASTGFGLGENARAALITRGLPEMIKIVKVLGGNPETVYGLTGIGDLIVTASSRLSRNFKAGEKIGLGHTLEQIYAQETQTIEGINTIYALYKVSQIHDIELPMIQTAYHVLEGNISIEDGLSKLLNRELKEEALNF